MKRKFISVGLISIALIIGFVVLGCGGGSGPSAVYKKYYAAMEKGDIKALIALYEPEAGALISAFLEGNEEGTKAEMKKTAGEYGGIDKIEETIDGDTATLKITYKNGKTDNQKLVKVGGKWKLSMAK
jgi:ketosteroid isomerase-like protein